MSDREVKGMDVGELLRLCRELIASASPVVMAGRVTVADTPLQWLRAEVAKADAEGGGR